MKNILPFLRYFVVAAIIGIGIYLGVTSIQEKAILERDAKIRQKIIEGLRIKEANQEKRFTKLLADYDRLKDTLAIERAHVKKEYIRYEEPVKVDLSTDHKRDSVINQIIR